MSDRTRRLHMIGNAHLDPVWLWQWPEGYAEVRATFRSALDRMREYPEFRFSQGSAAYYAWLEEADPDAFSEIRRRVEEGRWELAGGWWVEPDCNLPGGESFVRQALHGQRYFVSRFGRTAAVGVNVDPFGHAATLPALLRGAGLDAYVFLRPGPHEMPLPPVFRWEAPDGSQVLACRVPNEYCAPGGDVGGHVDKVVAHLGAGWSDGLCLYGVGNHGGGPTKANLDSIARLNGTDQVPELRPSTLGAFVASQAPRAELPVVRGELQHHAVGCYSAHSGIKRWVRRTEAALLAAERFAAIGAWLGGPAYPRADLARAWQDLLFNEFHDILAGTAVAPAYDDARDQLGEASAIAARALNAGVQAIARRLPIPFEDGTWPIVVANPHPWPVRTAVEVETFRLLDGFSLVDADGVPVPVQATRSNASTLGGRQRVVFVADVPALGYRWYRLRPSGGSGRPYLAYAPASAAREVPRPGTVVLENELVRLELDAEDGAIVRLVERGSGAAVVDAAVTGRRPRAIVHRDESDTWSHRVLAWRDVVGSFACRRVAVLEDGSVRQVVRVESAFGASTLVEDFVLSEGLPLVEVRVTLDWRERAQLLKLRVPVAVADAVATHEVPFGALVRPADGTEFPAQAWVDVSGSSVGDDGGEVRVGMALLNDGKPGADVRDGEIGLTAVRSPAYAHHEPAPLPEDDRAQWMDQGVQTFRYGLLAHTGVASEPGVASALARAGAEFAFGPIALLDAFHEGVLESTGSFLSVAPSTVVATAVKLTEDDGDDLVVRLREVGGVAAEGFVRVGYEAREVPFAIGPFALVTLRIPRDPSLPATEVNLVEWPVESGGAAPTGDAPSTAIRPRRSRPEARPA